MKLLTFEYDNKKSLGILVNNNKIYPIKKIGINYESMNELICNISDEEIKLLNNKIFEGFCDNDLISVEEVKKSAPIPIPAQDIICLGINYSAHAEESARYKKEAFEKDRKYPVYFSIDKDVLSEQVVTTDWQQGQMRLIEFKLILADLIKRGDVIGIDICGECCNEVAMLSEIKNDDSLNAQILEFLKCELVK